MPLIPLLKDWPLHGDTEKFLQRDIASFEELCGGIYTICKRSDTFRLGNYEQSIIYEKLLTLKKEGVDLQEDIPRSWYHPTALAHWIVIVSHCKDLPQRDTFLKLEAQLLEQMQNLVNFEIKSLLVCYTLEHLPKLIGADNLSLILQKLLPYLIQIKETEEVIVLEDISRALQGLKYIDQRDPYLQKVLEHLAWHIDQNARQNRYFNDIGLAKSFNGLGNMLLNPSNQVVLDALLKNLQYLTREKEWLDGEKLALIMEGLQNMPSHPVTDAIVLDITQHLHSNAERGKWIEPYTLYRLIGAVRSMQENAILNSFFDAIKRHFEYKYSHEQRPVSVTPPAGKALTGLRNLSGLPTIKAILDLFKVSLTLPDTTMPSTANYLQRWLANAIYSLEHYFAHPTMQQTAIDFIQRIVEISQPILPLQLEKNTLIEKSEHLNTILTLGKFILKDNKQIDLTHYPCSIDFIDFLCTSLNALSDTNYQDWTVLLDDNYSAYEKIQIYSHFREQLGYSIRLKSFEGVAPDITFYPSKALMRPDPTLIESSSSDIINTQSTRKRIYSESSSSEEITTEEEMGLSQTEPPELILKKRKLKEHPEDDKFIIAL